MFAALRMLQTAGAAGAPAMPSGALGIWYADEYDSATRSIPNAVTASPQTNLIPDPRRLFYSWVNFGVTVTDEDATAPDLSGDATTVVAAGNFYVAQYVNLAAGTYTIAYWVRSHSGSTETWKTTIGGTDSGALTVGSTWTRQVLTFTAGAPVTSFFLLQSVDGSTGTSLEICDVAIFAGASDLGVDPLVGNMIFKNSSMADGILDISAAEAHGIAQFQDAIVSDEWTVICMARKTGASSGYNAPLSKYQSWAAFSTFIEKGTVDGVYYNSGDATGIRFADFFDLDTANWQVWGTRYSGSVGEYFIGKHLYSSVGVNAGNQSLRDFYVNTISAGPNTYGQGYKYHAWAFYDRKLTDAEYEQAVDALEAHAAAFSITPGTGLRFLIGEGDSLTDPSANSYFNRYVPNASPIPYGHCVATGGSQIYDLNLRLPALLKLGSMAAGRGSTMIVSVLLTNGLRDDPGTAPTTFLANLAIYCDALRAEGILVALGTLPPRADTDWNIARNIANPIIRTWVGTHCDAIIDFAADATMGPDAAASDLTYYSDGTHPTAAGQALLEPIYRAVINAL